MTSALGWFGQNKDALAGVASVFSMVGTLVAVSIFFFGLRQYSKAENWKRTEYLAKLFSDFSNDPGAVHAIWMIDGDDRDIYFAEGDERRPYPINQKLVIVALRQYLPGGEFSPVELHIRDSFDVFFGYISQVDRAIQNGLIDKDEVFPYFSYWIQRFNEKAENEEDEKLRQQMLNYVDVIGYPHVRRFFDRWPAFAV